MHNPAADIVGIIANGIVLGIPIAVLLVIWERKHPKQDSAAL
jgi:hypothetical protein